MLVDFASHLRLFVTYSQVGAAVLNMRLRFQETRLNIHMVHAYFTAVSWSWWQEWKRVDSICEEYVNKSEEYNFPYEALFSRKINFNVLRVSMHLIKRPLNEARVYSTKFPLFISKAKPCLQKIRSPFFLFLHLKSTPLRLYHWLRLLTPCISLLRYFNTNCRFPKINSFLSTMDNELLN